MKKIIVLIVLAGLGVFGWIRITNQLLAAEFREIIAAGVEATELAHSNAENYTNGTFSKASAEADIQKIEQSINILETKLKIRYPRLQELMVNHMKVAQNVIRFRMTGNDRLDRLNNGYSSVPPAQLLYDRSNAEDKRLKETIMRVCAYVETGLNPPLPANMRGDEDAFKSACAEMRTKSIKTVVKQSRHEEFVEIIKAGLDSGELANAHTLNFARRRFSSVYADQSIRAIEYSIKKLEAKECFYYPQLRDLVVRDMRIHQNIISYRLKGHELLKRMNLENIDPKLDFEWAAFSSEADAEDQKRKDAFKDVCKYIEQNIDTMPADVRREDIGIRSICARV